MKGGSAQQKQGPPPHPGGSWPFGSAEGPVLRLKDLVTEDQSVSAEKRHPLSPPHAPRCGHSAGPMHVLLAICNRSCEQEAGVGQQPWQSWQRMGLHPGLVRRPEGQLHTLPPHPDGQEAGTLQLPGAKKLLAPAAPVLILKTQSVFFLLRWGPSAACSFNVSLLLRRRGGWGTSAAWSGSSAK